MGHGLLAEMLLRERLIDVIDLTIYRLLRGRGRRFFLDGQDVRFGLTDIAWPPLGGARAGRERTSSIPVHELGGVVSGLGCGTTGRSVGQRVFGLARWHRGRTLAECVPVAGCNDAPLPGDVAFTV